MDFEPSEQTRLLDAQIERFMQEHIYPNEALAREQMEEADHDEPPVLRPIRDKAKALGLSLGDRACLALAQREALPVLTADRNWLKLIIGVEIKVIR